MIDSKKMDLDYSKAIYDTDSYKTLHEMQYPIGIKKTVAYLEARKSDISDIDSIVVFGLQIHLDNLSKRITMDDVNEAKTMFEEHIGGFNYDDWKYIVDKHDGYLPIKVRAVAEGTIVPVGNVILTVENTDDRLFWLPNFIETKLMRVWKPITIATISYKYKAILKENMLRTCDNLNGLPFMVHDFSSRSASGYEDSYMGSLAHLVNFMGTDTTSALFAAKKFYAERSAKGYSVYATEHSVVTSYGRENEVDAYRNIYNRTVGNICSVVSDSYDIENAISNIWGGQLLDMVEKGSKTLVIRVDSGDTVDMVRTALTLMQEKFSYYINSKGYKVFNKVKVLQGDGVNFTTMKQILTVLEELKFSTDVIVFGIGSELCHKFNRDTFAFAMKMCANTFDGITWNDIYKDPKGSFKKSKKGLLGLYLEDGKMVTKSTDYDTMNSDLNLLKPVFENGKILKTFTLDEIRATISNQ